MTEIEAIRAVLVVLLVLIGCFFLIVGTIGLLRFPNVYNRMHATSKPTVLGTVTIFLAGFVGFGPGGAGLTSLVGIVFLFLTVPTGAHMISRAAQKTGVPFLGGVTWPTERQGEDTDREGKETDREGKDIERQGEDTDRKGQNTETGSEEQSDRDD